MGICYVASGGNVANSGSSDSTSADLTGSVVTAATTTLTLDGTPTFSTMIHGSAIVVASADTSTEILTTTGAHGFRTGDMVWPLGTPCGGMTVGTAVFVREGATTSSLTVYDTQINANSLSTTTGLVNITSNVGTGTLTKDSPAINIPGATNSNRQIFWIQSYNQGASTCVVDVAPTGALGGSWRIGGQVTIAGVTGLEGFMTAGHSLVLNESFSSALVTLTSRANGTAASGHVRVIGKSGAKRSITNTSTGNCVASAHTMWIWENIEFMQNGASGAAVNLTAGFHTFYDCKVSDAGGNCINGTTVSGYVLINCELSGSGAGGFSQTVTNGLASWVFGCYIHDVVTDGVLVSGQDGLTHVVSSVIDSCAGRAINYTSATSVLFHPAFVIGNTIYGSGSSGIECASVVPRIFLLNNIMQDNGNAAGEANVKLLAPLRRTGFHAWNVLYNNSGADGPIGVLLNECVTGTEFATDPLMTLEAGNPILITSADTTSEQLLTATHGYTTGDFVRAENGSGTLPTGLTNLQTYYVNVVDATHVLMYDTYANAVTGGATGKVNITVTGTGQLVKTSSRVFTIASTSPAKGTGFP